MPTLLDLTGHAIPENIHGRSFAPYLLGKRDPGFAPSYSFSERVDANPEHTRHVAPGTAGSFMVRGKGWKYIKYPDGEEFLYHLAEDLGETKNLATQPLYEEQKELLRHELQAWLEKTGYPHA